MNTFAHCLCALVIYALWWHKPLDVAEPIVLRMKSAHQFMAWTQSRGQGLDSMRLKEKAGPDDPAPIRPDAELHGTITLDPGVELLGTGLCSNTDSPMELEANAIERWKLAAPVFREFGYLPDTQPVTQDAGLELSIPTDFPQDVTYNPDQRATIHDYMVPGILMVSGIVYGGLHALAWNAPFRNPTERLLWRISSVIIMGYGPITMLFVQLVVDEPFHSKQQADEFFALWEVFLWFLKDTVAFVKEVYSSSPRHLLLIPLILLLNMAFVFARVYLIWESLWGLFHSVPGVFTTPIWADYYPHFG
jgi:hypothetical protein